VDTNIKGTLNVLQPPEGRGARLVVTSTSEVYGTAQYVRSMRNTPSGPITLQRDQDRRRSAAEAFHRSFGMPIIIARPFNTYGPRQSARAVIPTIITQLLAGETEIRLGNLHPTRDLVFVKDTVEAWSRWQLAMRRSGKRSTSPAGRRLRWATWRRNLFKS